MKKFLNLLLFVLFTQALRSQPLNCTFKPAVVTINFGTGNGPDPNIAALYNYRRVSTSCPTDGHYAYTSSTSNCFSNDWFTLPEDHTPGDADGNMMLVNGSPRSGSFFGTAINGLKANTTYEFAVWMMNLCKITDKCPFPLLPDITIQLQTPAGKIVAQLALGEIPRVESPQWTPYRVLFTTPNTETPLALIMSDNNPGGCGNDFAMDDITFRECVKTPPVVKATPKAAPKKQPPPPAAKKTTPPPPVAVKKAPATKKPVLKKETPAPEKPLQVTQMPKPQTGSPAPTVPTVKQRTTEFALPPRVLLNRANPVVKQFETEAGEIRFDLYDNGEIDGDTVTVYHNNVLVVAHARLSEKPITFRIAVDAAHPHHELVMVADNLGSIPPNTSLMVVTTATTRYEVFISSTEQKNAKLVIDLKE